MSPQAGPTASERALSSLAAGCARVAEITAQICALDALAGPSREEAFGAESTRRLHLSGPYLAERNRVRNLHSSHSALSETPSNDWSPVTGLTWPNMSEMERGCVSTPALWKAVGPILRRGERGREEQQLCLLETFLTRSGSCPLSLKLDCTGSEQRDGRPFSQTVVSHSARWEHWTCLCLRFI
ncbi:hypothetical protein DFH07DRAFT_117861 [Mycena maculata]|uniref:Uncharacterized protein n=1 Tax=Mycena maculata TaxID=230809 RepID=A0AAD7I5K8_9AGAR|nr:hypothetical protein DFH07DRAFT_117861 [Mycena maculata]